MLFAALFVIQQPKVSLEICGERLVVCAPKIAQALGMDRLDIKTPFQEEVAAIRVTNVDRETFKKKIEQAFRGTFIQREGTWSFEQTPEQKLKEETDHFESLRKQQQAFVDDAKKVVKQYKPFTKEIAEWLLKSDESEDIIKVPWEGSDLWQSPLGRLVVGILSRLSTENWHDVDHLHNRVVYSRYPTPRQRAMPAPIETLVRQFLKDQAIYAKVMKRKFDETGMSTTGGWEHAYGPMQVSDVNHLTVTLYDSSVDFCAYDTSGSKTLSADLELSEFENWPYNEPAKIRPPTIKFLNLSRQYVEARYPRKWLLPSRRSVTDEDTEVSVQLREALLHPETKDPLSFVIPEALVDSNPGRNIVANLFDELMYYYEDMSEAYLRSIMSSQELESTLVSDRRWLMVRPGDPYIYRQSLINRSRMGSLLQHLATRESLTLEEQATWPELLSNSYGSTLSAHLGLIQKGRVGLDLDQGSFLRLYGALSPNERKAAAQGQITLGKLSETFVNTLQRSIFHDLGIWVDLQMGSYNFPNSEAEKEHDRMVSFLFGIGKEPTFALSNGLGANMTLRLEEKSSIMLALARKSVATPGSSEVLIGVEELGSIMATNEFNRGKKEEWDDTIDLQNFDLNSVHIAEDRRIRIVLDTKLGFEYSISASQPIRFDSKTHSIRTLPIEMQKTFQESYEFVRKVLGRTEKTQPPPPPP